MIDLDDVLAHAHENCVACEGTGVVRRWSPGGPCPDGQTVCESCGPCQQSDIPALVAALRDARAEVERLRTVVPASVLDDIESMSPNRDNGERYGSVSWRLIRERDDWRRRYEALRDGVTGLHFRDARGGCASCIDPDGFSVWWPCETAAVVARVEGDES